MSALEEGKIYTMRETTHLTFIGDMLHLRYAVTVREGRDGSLFMTAYENDDDPTLPTAGRRPEATTFEEAVEEGLRWLKKRAFGEGDIKY